MNRVILHHNVTSIFFPPLAISKHFFILFPCPETHKNTPTQPPGLLRALESNFLLIKFTIKGPLMPASATPPFVSPPNSIVLNYIDFFEQCKVLFTENLLYLLLAVSSEGITFSNA